MCRRCYRDGQFEQAVGIALESRRLDKLAEAIQKSPDPVALLTYSLGVCQSLVTSREFRQQVGPGRSRERMHSWECWQHSKA
jgi:26S proteasome regulatory subunit N2